MKNDYLLENGAELMDGQRPKMSDAAGRYAEQETGVVVASEVQIESCDQEVKLSY